MPSAQNWGLGMIASDCSGAIFVYSVSKVLRNPNRDQKVAQEQAHIVITNFVTSYTNKKTSTEVSPPHGQEKYTSLMLDEN